MLLGNFHIKAISMQGCDLICLPRRYGRERQIPKLARKGPVVIASNGRYPGSLREIRQRLFNPFALRRARLRRVDKIAEKYQLSRIQFLADGKQLFSCEGVRQRT